MTAPQTRSCIFCAIVAGEGGLFRTNPHLIQDQPPPYRDRDIIMVPDAAPLGLYHILAMPRQHFLSAAEMAQDQKQELLHTLSHVAAAIGHASGEGIAIYFFEHGSRIEDQATGCATTHAHFHLFAAEPGLIRGPPEGFQEVDSIHGAWQIAKGSDYYLLGEWPNPVYLATLVEDPELRCHLFARKFFAHLLNRPEWADYARYAEGCPDEMVLSVQRTYLLLKSISPL